MSAAIKQGIIIPVYNHGKALSAVVEKLIPLGLPIIIVDDGSDAETKACLKNIFSSCALAVEVTLKKNSGKGRAVIEGIKKAHELGISHVLQIDADGQHDSGRAAFFLEESASNPRALIFSRPLYDESVSAGRKHGRKIANTWAKIVTFSPEIVETMLGFRVYPVEPVYRLCRKTYMDPRMGFDIEILVRLVWKNVPVIFHPVKVTYPADGISHFHMVKDNIRISWTFTRLCFGMLIRLPVLLFRVIQRTGNKKERR